MNIFQKLLDAVAEQKNLTTRKEKVDYLISLRDTAIALRKSFSRNAVRDYTAPKTQHVYLLRYFPFYAKLPIEVLRSLKKTGAQLSLPEATRVAFFGCGPAPEMLGVLEYLKGYPQENEQAYATTGGRTFEPWFFDKHAEQWEPLREAVFKRVTPSSPRTRQLKEGHPINVDIMDFDIVQKTEPSRFHLAVFQNFLTEVESHALAAERIEQIIKAMPSGAFAILIDLSFFTPVLTLKKLWKWAEKDDTVKIWQAEFNAPDYDCRKLFKDMRETLICGNLFETGMRGGARIEKLRSEIPYCFLVLQRCDA